MPMPPAMKRNARAGDPKPGTVSGNALRGPWVCTVAPSGNSWTSREPPPPSGMRRTAIR